MADGISSDVARDRVQKIEKVVYRSILVGRFGACPACKDGSHVISGTDPVCDCCGCRPKGRWWLDRSFADPVANRWVKENLAPLVPRLVMLVVATMIFVMWRREWLLIFAMGEAMVALYATMPFVIGFYVGLRAGRKEATAR